MARVAEMTGRAHWVIGACAAVPVAMLAGDPLALFVCGVAGIVGGLLPDIDHPGSTLGRHAPWPSVTETNEHTGFVAHGRRWFGGHVVWHRGETHSLGAAGLAFGVTTLGLWWPVLSFEDWAQHKGFMPVVGLPAAPWLIAGAFAGWIGSAVFLGYLSHLVADLVNISPQMLWWPFSRRMVHIPGWHGVAERSTAGRWVERLAMWGALLAAWAMWAPRPW